MFGYNYMTKTVSIMQISVIDETLQNICDLRPKTKKIMFFFYFKKLFLNISQMHNIYENKFLQFNFESKFVMISIVIISILFFYFLFLTSGVAA